MAGQRKKTSVVNVKVSTTKQPKQPNNKKGKQAAPQKPRSETSEEETDLEEGTANSEMSGSQGEDGTSPKTGKKSGGAATHHPCKEKDLQDHRDCGIILRDVLQQLVRTGDLELGKGIRDQDPAGIAQAVAMCQERYDPTGSIKIAEMWLRIRFREYLKTIGGPIAHPHRVRVVRRPGGKTHRYRADGNGKMASIDLTGDDAEDAEGSKLEVKREVKREVKKEGAKTPSEAGPSKAAGARQSKSEEIALEQAVKTSKKPVQRSNSPGPVTEEVNYEELPLGAPVGIGLKGQKAGCSKNRYCAYGVVSLPKYAFNYFPAFKHTRHFTPDSLHATALARRRTCNLAVLSCSF